MFVRQPQFRNSNADVQIFYGTNRIASQVDWRSWNKPPGVSHVYILVIGAGGNGNASSGGGSGGVHVWYGAAQNVPDSLQIQLGSGGNQSTNIYYNFANSVVSLMDGSTPSFGGPAGAPDATSFTASGFNTRTAGQQGSTGTVNASSDTFLSGGGAYNSNQTSNYGYSSGPTTQDRNGYFLLQPIIVGTGAMGAGKGVIGCGGGVDNGLGGPGMVLIASW